MKIHPMMKMRKKLPVMTLEDQDEVNSNFDNDEKFMIEYEELLKDIQQA